MKKHALFLAVVVGAGATGCSVPESRTAHGVVATDAPRVWVIRSTVVQNQVIQEVYRCADGADEKAPPKPVCVKAPMTDGP